MAFATKYQFTFESIHGITGTVLIQQDGYSGSVVKRALGRAPLLKKDSANNGIYGTSLELYAECTVDGEFADLYTSDSREYLVLLQRGNDTIWKGFVTPELYAEPDIAPPYDVQVTATDGLGELKNYDFTDFTRRSIRQHLLNILSYTGLAVVNSDLILVSSLQCQSPSITSLLDAYINPAHLEGKSAYDDLVSILENFHLSITQYNGKWLLVRVTDIVRTDAAVAAIDGAGTAVSLPVASFGSLRTCDWWPVGNLTKEVVPAKNRVTADLPFQFYKSMFTNPEFENGTTTGWTGSGVSFAPGTYGVNKPVIAYDGGYISQSFAVTAFSGRLSLKWMAATIQNDISWLEARNLQFGVEVSVTGGGSTYYLCFNAAGQFIWQTTRPDMSFQLPVINGGGSRMLVENDFTTLDEFKEIPGFPVSGTLTFKITNNNNRSSVTLVLWGVYLTTIVVNGYRDVVNLSNNARGELPTVTMEFGDPPTSLVNVARVLKNAITNSNGVTTSAWVTARLSTPKQLISIMALDYALENALPRLKVKGAMNVPAATIPPFLLGSDNITYGLETFEWDLYNEELQLEMISQPAVSMTVSSESMRTLSNEEYEASQESIGSTSTGQSGNGNTVNGVNLAFHQDFGFIVLGSGTRDINVELSSGREIPYTDHIIHNDETSAAVKRIVVCSQYPSSEDANTLYLLYES